MVSVTSQPMTQEFPVAFSHTLVTLEAINRAKDLARLSGGQDYIKASAKTISDDLLALSNLPAKITRGAATQRTNYELRRVIVKPSVRRSLPKARREQLERNYPGAYQAAVRSTPPETPYHVRLDANKVRASQEWATAKSEGHALWVSKLTAQFGLRQWTPVTQAEILFELKELARSQGAAIDKAKDELMEFVLANELPLVIPGLLDGKLVLRANAPKIEVDYDLLEQRFPQAATLINRAESAGYERIDFAAWAPTPEEPDDSDDSAWGIWKD